MDDKCEEGGNLSSNCEQVFQQGPKVTEEFLSRLHRTEKARKRRFIFGYEFTGRDICVLATLFLFFNISLIGTVAFWFTSIFETIAYSNLPLRNGSQPYQNFVKPTANPFIIVHVFNYTNVENYEKGIDAKLKVEDIGPYVFLNTIERVNPVFGEDGTLTFQEKHGYQFLPEKSQGRKQSDMLTVPNLPLLGVSTMVEHEPYFIQFGVGAGMRGIDAKPFLTLPAHRFMWGYDDKLFTIAKNILAFRLQSLPYEKFGLLAAKNGTSSDRITVATGINDINNIGKVISYNGQKQMHHWSTDECNRMDGYIGVFFSPYAIKEKKPISVFQKEICRKLPFEYEKEVRILPGLSAYRYVPPKNTFGHPDSQPSNQCFCHMDSGNCAPHGVMNATPCAYGPAYLSFPHFLEGDPKLVEDIEGLNPDKEIHGTYLDINPVFGFTMAGHTRLQINMQVKKPRGISQLNHFQDDLMLPVAWVDSGIEVEDLPPEITDIYYQTAVTVPNLEIANRYVFLILTILTFLAMIFRIQTRLKSKLHVRRVPPFQRNISGLSSLIPAP